MQRKQTLADLNRQQFTTVYQFAKERNLQGLQDWFNDGQNLDVSIGIRTVTGELAFEGDHEAVTFMLIHFDLSRNYVARAYAQAGYYSYLSSLGPIDPNYVACGAAERGNTEWVLKMSDKGIKLESVIQSYALGRHTKHAEELLFSEPTILIFNNGAFIETRVYDLRPAIICAANGYALNDHADLLQALLDKAAELDKTQALPGFNRYKNCLSKAGIASAQTNKREKAEAMIARGADLSEVAIGAAIYGDTEFVEALIKRGAQIQSAIFGYATRWSFFNEESTLQLLAFTADEKLRTQFAHGALQFNKELNPQSLIMQATRLHQLMQDHNLTYNNARKFLTEQKRCGLFSQLKPIVVHESQSKTLAFK